jgi:hypothetical protein
MPETIERAARIAYAFVAMNWAVVRGLVRLLGRGEVWR